jgi:peptide chain release factor 2
VQKKFDDIKSLLPEADALGDEAFLEELTDELKRMDGLLEELEFKKMLSGELDNKNCYLSINSGAGGTEACDWTEMLARMYRRWAEKKGWKIEVVDVLEGDVAGLKNITFKIQGPFAYGYAKAEKGVHRLVRISPFDANAKRHTSFAGVDVVPEISDDIEIEVRSEDLRVDTYRASGAGGQHVNKTDSAVRMTHIPSGIIVSSQTQRSQIQNREACLKMLKSRLYELEVEKRNKTLKEISGEQREIAFGSQSRNYVFHPYNLVKDTRTGKETSNIQAVMDGEIDEFIHAYLRGSQK